MIITLYKNIVNTYKIKTQEDLLLFLYKSF